MTLKLARRTALAALGLALLATGAQAQADYPNRPITLMVGLAAGGITDVTARLYAEAVAKVTGQRVIVENKTGAGGIVGSELVAKAPADGYTLLIVSIAHAVNPALYDKLPYDFERDLAPITQLTTSPQVLVVSLKLPVKSVGELIALAKANPDKLAFATSGPGSSNHILGVMLAQISGTKLIHIPYRGAGPAMQDTIAGNVPSMFDSLPSAAPHIKAGKVRALAFSGDARLATMPEVLIIATGRSGTLASIAMRATPVLPR